jgi:L-threonylcarbamoyladenylate synthase
MKTQIIPATEIQTALEVLQNGGIVAFPTDTVYGLGALAFDNSAIESIYVAKNRPVEKAIPVLVGDIKDFDLVAENIPDMALKFAEKFLPGALTCVVPKKLTLPPAISSTHTVAVRIPNQVDVLKLLTVSGALAVTSANISGQSSPVTAQEVYEQLNGRIPLILDGGKTLGGVPSTLVDCTGEIPVILREGPISLEELLSVLK